MTLTPHPSALTRVARSLARPPFRVTLATATLPWLAACGDPSPEAAQLRMPPVPVTLATVGQGAPTSVITATGTFVSRDEIPLGFKIGGVVMRVLVDEGATVQRGQILAALDLREIDAAVAKAQVAADKALRDHGRAQRLAADSVATLAQLQDATSALDAARADLATARMNRDYAVIVAPEAGSILQRLVTPGTTVSPGTPMFVLGGARRGRVLRAGLPDHEALRVNPGDAATVTFAAVPGRTFPGKVVLVGRAADPRTGTYNVEVAITGADALPSGLVGTLQVTVKSTGVASTVPVEALLEADADLATVLTAHRDADGQLRATATRVRIGRLTGDRVAVNGVADGVFVVARGATMVTPGAVLREISDQTLDSIAPLRHGTPVATRGRSATAPRELAP